MTAEFAPGSICRDCAFWARLDKLGGRCRRHAPQSGDSQNEIAHWPRTNETESCGEWQAQQGDKDAVVACEQCRFWRPHVHGSWPVDLQDQFGEWWKNSGTCLRFAPAPNSDPGNRAFWRATHASDACHEGAPKISKKSQ